MSKTAIKPAANAVDSTLETRAESARVTREPSPYEAASPHSWIRDRIVTVDSGLTPIGELEEARSRLNHHEFDVAEAVEKRSEYGVKARRMIGESLRGANPDKDYHEVAVRERLDLVRREVKDTELRTALTTGGGSTLTASAGAAAVVPPAIVLKAWVPYRTAYRSVADECDTSEPLPDYGMQVAIPAITSPPSVSAQTEGDDVSDTTPTMGLITADVSSLDGQVEISQQYLDRAGPGIGGDQILFAQLREQLDQQVDELAIAAITANAQTVSNSGTFALATASGAGGFINDIKKAKSLIRNTPGVRLNATHCFAVGDFTDYLVALADAQGRPWFMPHYNDMKLPTKSLGMGKSDQDGYYNVASLMLMPDDNIPNNGDDIQIVVARPSIVSLLEGTAIPSIWPQSIAGSLLAIVGLRQYAAVIPRYPTGAAVITGSAYAASTFA